MYYTYMLNWFGFNSLPSNFSVRHFVSFFIFIFAFVQQSIDNNGMVSWSKNQTVEFKAKEDSEYTGKLTEIDVDFEVQGRDPKYNNMTMPTLKVYLWDDRSITLGKEEKKPPDYALLIAIIVAVSAALCFMASVIRKRIQKHREWKLHHDLLSICSEYVEDSSFNFQCNIYILPL